MLRALRPDPERTLVESGLDFQQPLEAPCVGRTRAVPVSEMVGDLWKWLQATPLTQRERRIEAAIVKRLAAELEAEQEGPG